MTATATAATKALRTIWPKPITLRSTVNAEGYLEVTTGRGVRAQAEGASRVISAALGTNWKLVRIESLRENIRIVYRLAPAPATFDKIGMPHTWKPAQVDEKTVIARHAAIHDQGLRTGEQAEPGQLVIHVELGLIGAYVRSEPSCSYARFAYESDESLVHPDDLVVLADSTDWLGCWVTEDETHLEHAQAVTPECLVGDPDAEIEGPELIEVRPGRWESADGIYVVRDADGTYAAWDERGISGAYGSHRDRSICSGQTRLESTYRPINRRRTAVAEHRAAMHEIAADVDAAITVVARMETAVAEAADAWQSAFEAGRPGNYERQVEARARLGLARAKLFLAQLLGDHRSRLVTVEALYDDAPGWELFGSSLVEIERGDTPAGQALRYAVDQRWAGPDRWRSTNHPLRVRVYADPASLAEAGEWTNLTDPCRAGEHDADGNHSRVGAARTDGTRIEIVMCAHCGHKVWRVLRFVTSDKPTAWILEGEPLPDPEPGVICLPVECLRTEHYGMIASSAAGGIQEIHSVGPVDPDAGTVPLYVRSAREPLCVFAGTMLQLRPRSADEGPGLGLDGPDPDPDPDRPDPDLRTPGGVKIVLAGMGLGPDAPPVSFGYRVRTQTDGGTKIVRTGTLPAIWRPVRPDIGFAAETVLGNARQVLGLGDRDPLPPVEVQTWDRQSGLTATATRV